MSEMLLAELAYYKCMRSKFEKNRTAIEQIHGKEGLMWLEDQLKRVKRSKRRSTEVERLRAYTKQVRTLTALQPLHTLKGIEGRAFFGAHVDHVVSIRHAFLLKWSVGDCADISNLQILSKDENQEKGNGSYCKWPKP